MSEMDRQKKTIEREIERARDGVSERIDELDRRLRTSLDVRSALSEHAPKIVAGGAVVGFLAAFGFPRLFRKALKIGIPIALVSLAVMKARNGAG
ncbi:MAG TPA: hypothetical protein VNA04_16760 [Thermoanaerobaculia bacterium]|nr:hypothetical protein [Thermoanaerobaculia bacterium]